MKKKIVLEKKLAFSKTTIAALTASQQELIAGGKSPITNQPNCTTIIETCNTSPSPKEPCWICQ